MNDTTQNKTTRGRGFAIAAAAIAVLFGMVYLKARADSGEDFDLDT